MLTIISPFITMSKKKSSATNASAKVKTNILQVTLFGQSSGGTSVYGLLGSPLTKNLYHRAWMASASPIMNKTASQAFKDNEVFLRNTKCQDVDCLYNMSAAEIIAAIPWTVYPNWGMGDLINLPIKGEFDGALAVVDGWFLACSKFLSPPYEPMLRVKHP